MHYCNYKIKSFTLIHRKKLINLFLFLFLFGFFLFVIVKFNTIFRFFFKAKCDEHLVSFCEADFLLIVFLRIKEKII